jgi:hypothetical protein
MQKLEQLKTIKAFEDINIDFTLYYISIGLIILAIVSLWFILYMVKKIKQKPTKKQLAKKYLKALNLNQDSKQVAYDFTLYGYECLNTKFQDEFDKIVLALEPYKYKKDVHKIDQDLLNDIKEYIKVRL